MAKRQRYEPKKVYDQARDLSRLVRQASNLDGLRRRVANDDPPATDWHRDKLAKELAGSKAMLKQLASLAKDVAQAAKAWGLPGPAAEIESVARDKRYHGHDAAFDVLPAIRRVENEAAARMGIASKPSREAAEFKIKGGFIPGIGPAEVPQIFGESNPLYLPASHYKDTYGIPTSRLRKAAEEQRIGKRGTGKQSQYLDADVRRLWREDFLIDEN